MSGEQGDISDPAAAGTTPERATALHASAEARERVADLLRREKNDALTEDEVTELSLYLELEHIMRLAKAGGRCES